MGKKIINRRARPGHDAIRIGEHIVITVTETATGHVVLAIDAPADIRVVERERQATGAGNGLTSAPNKA